MPPSDSRQQLVNEISYIVVGIIQETIAKSPRYSHREVFSTSTHHRELLLLRVIKDIYDYYVGTRGEAPTPLKMFYFCLTEQETIAAFVRRSAGQVLEEERNREKDTPSNSQASPYKKAPICVYKLEKPFE